MSKSKYSSSFLLKNINFITGMGSVFNLGGNYYEFNTSKTEDEADKKAIENDFGMVGEDIKSALGNFKEKHA